MSAQFYPSTERNKGPIAETLATLLPAEGTVLTVAEGSGQQVEHFAAAYPSLTWQPSDPDPEARASIAARTANAANVRPPLDLDVTAADWRLADVAAVVCSNMVHIAPWAAAVGLMRGAARVLTAGGLLVTYGPYKQDGAHTSAGNAAFDDSLRRQNPDWGIRDMADLAALASDNELTMEAPVPMPANNFCLPFRKPVAA